MPALHRALAPIVLVAAVAAAAVYFPKGTWRSYWDPGQLWRGPRTETLDVLDTILVFQRGAT